MSDEIRRVGPSQLVFEVGEAQFALPLLGTLRQMNAILKACQANGQENFEHLDRFKEVVKNTAKLMQGEAVPTLDDDTAEEIWHVIEQEYLSKKERRDADMKKTPA